MESINQFNKGLNKDTNNLQTPKGSYKDALNIRIINDADSTSLSINNILGNDFKLTIPDSPLIQKVTIISELAAQNIIIDGQIGFASINTTGFTGEDLYDFITTDPNFTKCNQNPAVGTKTYNIYYNSNYVIIVPIVYSVAIPITTPTPALSLNNSYVPAQSNLEIIGSTTIRDDIYLFTTSNTTQNPGGHSNNSSLAVDPSSVGVIWKLTYNKISNIVAPLTLIYSNYLDFSTYYAIPPSACLGRYENTETQRLYWTDNFNKLRSLNVADDQVLALDLSILDITPSVDLDIPKLQGLQHSTGSDLAVGTIQCAYRLKNTSGAITTFSELSNLVTLVFFSEAHQVNGTGFSFYVGNNIGTAVSKAITWDIDNIDRDFDRIEVAIIFRESLTATPLISLLDDAPINSDSYTVVYDGTQNTTLITLNEFLALSGSFTHCKTIDTKDNRLFVANTRNQFSDLDYDARVYRFPISSYDLSITENGTTNIYDTDTTGPQGLWTTTGQYPSIGWDSIDEESDAINPNQDVNKYKRNSTVIGGNGPNISYEFYTVAIAADIERAPGDVFNVPDETLAPWRFTYTRTGQGNMNLDVYSAANIPGNLLQEYPTTNTNDGFKYPMFNGLFCGYQRNETYRFGILFKDKAGNPFFTKWVGDIKMPDYNDVNTNAFYEDGTAVPLAAYGGIPNKDFRPSFTAVKTHANREAFVQSLGIQFTVNIPDNIIDLISGYEIVRVERTESDKTVVCEGFVNRVVVGSGTDYYMTDLNLSPASGGNDLGGLGGDDSRMYFVTPNLCNLNLTQPASGMTFKVKGQMIAANSDAIIDYPFTAPGGDPFNMFKLYSWDNTLPVTTSFNIDACTYLPVYGQTVSGGGQAYNYDYDTTTLNVTTSQSLGNPCYWLELDAALSFTLVNFTGNRFLISIEQTPVSAYGGNTYTARASNIYQSCSMFRPTRYSQFTIADTPIIFGGDTFVNMYDSCRWAKNWDPTKRGVSVTNKRSATFYCPLSSQVNTDLRHGVYMNKNMTTAYVTGSIFFETYDYNTIYSATNNTKQYFPKPDPFILNEEYDTRFHASEIKINGELVDSWGVFLPNNYWDVEGSYGPVNAITVMQDKMYFWQDRAFGTMSINPRVMVTDTGTDALIQLGTGDVLQRHDYISIEVGLQHQWGMTKSSNSLYWMDIDKKKFFKFNGQLTPTSDVKGMFSWFNNYLKNNINILDKPTYSDPLVGINGIRSVYDYKYNQAIFTFTDSYFAGFPTGTVQSKYTLAYDDFIDAFTSFYSYTPKVYVTDFIKILSTDPSNLSDIYMHDIGDYCNFYNTVYPSSIKLVVNDNPTITKAFDNIMYDSQSLQYNATLDNYQNDFLDTWESIRVYNDHQNTDFQSIALNSGLKRKERTWQLQIPRNRVLYTANPSPNIFDPTELSTPNNKTFGERIRDKYMIIDLTYNNSTNRLLTCNNLRTIYRPSSR